MKFRLILIFVIYTFLSHAQENDSLFIKLKSDITTASNDSLKIKAFYEAGMFLFGKGDGEAQPYFEEGLMLLSLQAKSKYYTLQKINFLSRLGGTIRKKGLVEEGLKNYFEAKQLAIEMGDEYLAAEIHHNIGQIFGKQRDLKKAIQYLKEAVAVKEKYGDSVSLAYSYNALGVNFRKSKELDSALFYYQKAKPIFDKFQDTSSLYRLKNNIAIIYITLDENDKALQLLKESIPYYQSQNNIKSLSDAYYNIAISYKNKAQYQTTLKYLDSSFVLAKKAGLKRRITKVYNKKSEAYSGLKDFENALINIKIHKELSDSLFNNEKTKKLTQIEYDHKLVIEKIKLDDERKLLVLKTKNQRQEKIIYLILFLLTLLTGFFINRLLHINNRRKLKIADAATEKEKIEKLNVKLALKTRERDMKNIVVNNKMRQETQNQVLDIIRDIIKLKDEQERKTALNSIKILLLSNINEQKVKLSVQDYLDKVQVDFKAKLNTNFMQLNRKEKELLCLMKLGLNNSEISNLQHTSLAAVKSSRYRIRKKLELDSNADIMDFINNYLVDTN